MSLIIKKKIIIMLLLSMLCMTVFPLVTYANTEDVQSIQASEYIRSTSVVIVSESNGKLLLEN